MQRDSCKEEKMCRGGQRAAAERPSRRPLRGAGGGRRDRWAGDRGCWPRGEYPTRAGLKLKALTLKAQKSKEWTGSNGVARARATMIARTESSGDGSSHGNRRKTECRPSLERKAEAAVGPHDRFVAGLLPGPVEPGLGVRVDLGVGRYFRYCLPLRFPDTVLAH